MAPFGRAPFTQVAQQGFFPSFPLTSFLNQHFARRNSMRHYLKRGRCVSEHCRIPRRPRVYSQTKNQSAFFAAVFVRVAPA